MLQPLMDLIGGFKRNDFGYILFLIHLSEKINWFFAILIFFVLVILSYVSALVFKILQSRKKKECLLCMLSYLLFLEHPWDK